MADFCLRSDILEIASRLRELAPEFSGRTVLICGGRGFLGSYLGEFFRQINTTLKKPCRIIVLDNLITAGDKKIRPAKTPHYRFIRHDVIKPFRCDERVDFILHAAGIASPFYYRAFPLETLEVATLGTKNMLQLAQQHRAKILFFSSSEIYGDPDPRHVPTPESYRGNISCLGPRACYDESKRVGETLCYVFHQKFGTDVRIVRPFNIFGPGMPENDYRVLPNFASRIRAGLPLQVYGTGNQTRTFCYVTDGIVGFIRALVRGTPGEAYNIGNPRPEISMLELVKRVEAVLGRRIRHHVAEYPDSYPADEPNRRCPDVRKARIQLDYEPCVDLSEGLKRFFRWTDSAYSRARQA